MLLANYKLYSSLESSCLAVYVKKLKNFMVSLVKKMSTRLEAGESAIISYSWQTDSGWDITDHGQGDNDAMVEYAINTLDPSQTRYSKTWYKLFNFPIKSNWPLSLLVAELLFTLTVSRFSLL